MTQSAAQMVQKSQKIPTGSAPLDRLLDGGLSRGHILELSGPPGSPKQNIATSVVASFAQTGGEVIFLGKMAETTLLKNLYQWLTQNVGTTPHPPS